MRSLRVLCGLWGLTVCALCSGCLPWVIGQSSPLEGTWQVNADQPSLTQMLVTFNSRGRLTKVTYQIGELATVEETLTTGYGEVAGDAVSIQGTFGPSTFEFTGTFDEDRTRIDGRLTTELTLPLLRITIDNGPASLTRL